VDSEAPGGLELELALQLVAGCDKWALQKSCGGAGVGLLLVPNGFQNRRDCLLRNYSFNTSNSGP
jgi:hypothetical protein